MFSIGLNLNLIMIYSFSWNKVKLARSSRKNRVQQRKTAFLKQIQGGDKE